MRNTNKLVGWCVMASSYVRAKEDREEVKDELWAHIEDRYDSLLAGGVDDERAAELTLEAMGDAHEVGKLLRKIHKPYLSWAVTASKWLLILAALVWMYFGVFGGFIAELELEYGTGRGEFVQELEEDLPQFAGDAADTVRRLSVEGEAECEGYTFQLLGDAAWVWQEEGEAGAESVLWLGMRTVHPLPWRDSPEGVEQYLFAVDDLGNVYKNGPTTPYRLEQEANPAIYGRGLFSHYLRVWVEGIPQNAEWVELRYDRYGREFSLRVDLEGGENG